MEELFKILKKISTTNSRKEKEKIIIKNKNNTLFINTLKFLLNPYIVTNISSKKINKKINKDDIKAVVNLGGLDFLYDYLNNISTGKDIDIYVVQLFINKYIKYAEEIKLLVTKSMRLGITSKTVNKVLGYNLIPEFNCQSAHSYKDYKNKVKGNFILTTKLNGCKMIALVSNGKVTLKTRTGKNVTGDFIEIKEDLSKLKNGVYDGECLAIGEFKTDMEQYQATKKLFTKKGIIKGLKFVCYDYIQDINDFYNGKCDTSTLERKNQLKEILKDNYEFVKYLQPLYIGSDLEHITIEFNKALKNCEEGIMISLSEAPYECKRTTNLLKVKLFNEADIFCYDVYEGEGKNIGKLGGIRCKFLYKDKICFVDVGSGFTDNERVLYWNNPKLILNKVVTVNYKDIITDKDGNNSLYLVTWKHNIRADKESLKDTNV